MLYYVLQISAFAQHHQRHQRRQLVMHPPPTFYLPRWNVKNKQHHDMGRQQCSNLRTTWSMRCRNKEKVEV